MDRAVVPLRTIDRRRLEEVALDWCATNGNGQRPSFADMVRHALRLAATVARRNNRQRGPRGGCL